MKIDKAFRRDKKIQRKKSNSKMTPLDKRDKKSTHFKDELEHKTSVAEKIIDEAYGS